MNEEARVEQTKYRTSGKTVAIVQGRMGSSRLPGKILMDIAGRPMLAWVIERARLSRSIDEVIFATSADPSDDAVEAFCKERGYPLYRGSLHDVLDRFYQAARNAKADLVVRLTADCPLMDPELIDEVVAAFHRENADFAANRLPPPFQRTYPIGLDVEVCSFAALERAWKEAAAPHDREHVMPYLYEVDGRFKVFILNYPVDYGSLRWTVDTPADLDLVRILFQRLGNRPDFTWLDVLHVFEQDVELAKINADTYHKTFKEFDPRVNQTG